MAAPMAPPSLFCEHKKLRTGCPACKATAMPPPAPEAKPYVSSDERLERAEKKAVRAEKASAAGEPSPASEKAEARARGPGKPIMPLRARKKGISAHEADAATAWWVKKG